MRISDWSSDVCSSDLAPAQAQDDLLHRGSQARLDPPAADLTATAVNQTRRRVEQIALRNLDDIELDSDALGSHALAPGSGRGSEERRVGNACDRTCGSRWARDH